jgi:hypothetical protein
MSPFQRFIEWLFGESRSSHASEVPTINNRIVVCCNSDSDMDYWDDDPEPEIKHRAS